MSMRTTSKEMGTATIKSSSASVYALEQGRHRTFFQPKLTVNTPGDTYEQEADRVADQVMRMQAGDALILQRSTLTTLSNVQRQCAECEQEEPAQRKESGGAAGGFSAPPIVGHVLASGGGQAMDSGTRHFMESRFGQDFSQVRIHTGSRAEESAQSVRAEAYTVGSDIVFNKGGYNPQSDRGKHLLAHELTHTIQQRGLQAVQRNISSFPDDEKSNNNVQRSPLRTSVTRTPSPLLQRRGGVPVGTLCIRSNAINEGLTAGHAWLSYTPSSGGEITYGTWGNKTPIGLHFNLEVGRPYRASRCTEIDATDLSQLNSFATSNNTWSYTNNCSSFAARGWHQVTGESIPHTSFFIPNPSALGAGIQSLGGTLSPTAAAANGSSSF